MSKRVATTGRPAKRARSSKPTQRRAQSMRQLGVEIKYFDAPIGFVVTSSNDWTGSEAGADMPQIPQGDDIFNRNGRKIQLKRVACNLTLHTTPTTAATAISAPPPFGLSWCKTSNPTLPAPLGKQLWV